MTTTLVIWYLDACAVIGAVSLVANTAILAGWSWISEKMPPRKPTWYDNAWRVVSAVLYLAAWYALRVSR